MSDAREGRGKGNGYNDNWNNSPFWDNVGPDKDKKKTQDRKQKRNEKRYPIGY